MPESSTAFLDNILRRYNSRHPYRVSRATLAAFCQNNQKEFFTICQELLYLILLTLHKTPAPDIHNRVLETIASDLSAIVHPLWITRQGILQNHVAQARDLASSASKMKDGTRRSGCITRCRQELERAHALVGGI